VPSKNPTAFDRVFARRDLFRGHARKALAWFALSSVFFCLSLGVLWFLVDLLVTRGMVYVAAADRTEFVERFGPQLGIVADEADNAPAQEKLSYTDTGLLPTVWGARHSPLGRPLAAAWRALPILRTDFTALVALIALGGLLGLVRVLALARGVALSEAAGQDAASTLRRWIHRQVLRLGPQDLSEKGGEQALSLFLTDVETIRGAVAATVQTLGRYPFKLALLASLAMLVHWRMTLLCLLPLAGCWYLTHRVRRRSEQMVGVAAARADAELRLLAESFHTTRIVRGYSMEAFSHEQFQKRLDRYVRNVADRTRLQRSARWAGRLLALGGVSLVLFLLGNKILQTPDDLPFSSAVFLMLAVAAMYRPLERLRQLEPVRAAAGVAADRIYRYVDQIPEVSQAVGAKFLDPLSRSLKLEKVTYAPPRGARLLDGLDLTVEAGEVVAIVALDPLEPRALAHLLPRFIDPQRGRILIDGEDIALATLESLRAEVVSVSGGDTFFTGTVLENLTCGRADCTLPDATAAAKTAHAHNFIQKLPSGYETMLGEHGEQLEPGQSFRLSLARAVLRDPALLVIEEPADALDEHTKDLLEDAYNRITRDRTVIFLPSRMSTVRRADRIILLHQGKVEAVGKQPDLLRTSPLYCHWEYLRFNEFRYAQEPAPEPNALARAT